MHLRKAITPLMRRFGFGEGYQYPHNFEGHVVAQKHLPPELEGVRFYRPSKEGGEKRLGRRLAQVRKALSAQYSLPEM
jgi:putative ATPase